MNTWSWFNVREKFKSCARWAFSLECCYVRQSNYYKQYNLYLRFLYMPKKLALLLSLKCIIFGLSYFNVDIFWYKTKCKQTSICPVERISPWTSNSSLFYIIHWPWNVNIVFMILTINQYMHIPKDRSFKSQNTIYKTQWQSFFSHLDGLRSYAYFKFSTNDYRVWILP